MRNLGTKRLETDRLILRKFELSDAEPMYRNWANDPEVTKFLTWPPHDDVKVTADVLRGWISQYENDTFYQWAIVLKESSPEPIGSISILKWMTHWNGPRWLLHQQKFGIKALLKQAN